MFIVGSLIFLWAHKIFTSGAHMAPRKNHEVASLYTYDLEMSVNKYNVNTHHLVEPVLSVSSLKEGGPCSPHAWGNP